MKINSTIYTVIIILFTQFISSCDKNGGLNSIIEKEVNLITIRLFLINITTRNNFDTTLVINEKERILEFRNLLGEKTKWCACATLCEIQFFNDKNVIGKVSFSGVTGYSVIYFNKNSYPIRLSMDAMVVINEYIDLIRDKLGSGWRIQ